MPKYDMTFANAREAELIGGQELKNLLYFGKMQNVQIINGKANPYQGKLEEEKGNGKANPYIGKMLSASLPDLPVGISSLGTPVYSDLTLMGLSYTDNLTGKPVELKNDRYRTGAPGTPAANNASFGSAFYMNIETVLITVNQAVRIKKTEIQGRNGTVKEYIGMDDATLTINGIITGKNRVYPMEEVKRLKAWLDAPVSKSIVARWLGNLGIDNIVIESYSIPQEKGAYSYQTFSIHAISDFPVELKITRPVGE